jgi:hypothetical protein
MLHIPHTPFPIIHTNKTELFNNKNKQKIKRIPFKKKNQECSEFRVQTETSRMITSGEREESS